MRGAVLFVASVIGTALLFQRASVYYYDDISAEEVIALYQKAFDEYDATLTPGDWPGTAEFSCSISAF